MIMILLLLLLLLLLITTNNIIRIKLNRFREWLLRQCSDYFAIIQKDKIELAVFQGPQFKCENI